MDNRRTDALKEWGLRVLYVSFLLSCLALIVVLCFSTLAPSSPEAVAYTCLRIIKSGNVGEAAAMFGDNSCRCPPRGGWSSLLKYEWGQDPNLAFLVGHQFAIGRPRVTWVKDDTPYLWPWEAPESTYVDFPLSFAKAEYSPYFLPLDMAYGHTISEDDLKRWLSNPTGDDWKGFSSRLRAGLTRGTVPPAPDAAEEETQPVKDKEAAGQSATAGKKRSGKAILEELLGPEATRYLVAADAAPVTLKSGESAPASDFAPELPRLVSVTLRLSVQRRGQFKPWRIAKLKYMDAVVQAEGKEPVTLLNPKQ